MDNSTDPKSKKFNAAIAKLVELTDEGSLVWFEDRTFEGRGEEKLLGTAFKASLNSKWILAYEYEYKWYTDVDDFERRKSVAIEFVRGDDLGLEFRWYGAEGYRYQLMDAIRYQNAHVDAFFDQLLKS